jgi:hypothetical protein
MTSGRNPDRRQNLVPKKRKGTEGSSRTRLAGSQASTETSRHQMPTLAPQASQTGQHVAGRHQSRPLTQSSRVLPASASTASPRSIDRETSGTGAIPRASSSREAATAAGAATYLAGAVTVTGHAQPLPSNHQTKLTEVEGMAAAGQISVLDAQHSREYLWHSHRINILAGEVNGSREPARTHYVMKELEKELELENQLFGRLSETVIRVLTRR